MDTMKQENRTAYQVTASLRNHKALYRKVLALAKRRDRKVAEIIRYALDEYVDKQEDTQ